MIAFHVDRDTTLAPGAVLDLRGLPALPSPSQGEMAKLLCPNGVSEWGAWALLDASDRLALTLDVLLEVQEASVLPGQGVLTSEHGARGLRRSKDRVAEAVAELVRRSVAPEAPSRLACLFGYRDPAAAQDFRANYATRGTPIWRVEIPDEAAVHEGDSRLVGVPDTPLKLIDNARLYWSKIIGPAALPEHRELLLSCPVTVLERAD